MVSHSIGEDDLKVYDVLKGPSEFKGLLYNWDRMFGSTPREWEDEFSVLSHFPRSSWQVIKEEVDSRLQLSQIQ